MEQIYATAALWMGLALIATFLASRLRISTALMEILVGIVAAAVATRFIGSDALGADQEWLRFLASAGAVLLTFLAGAELEPAVMRAKWKEVSLIGVIGFAAPFLGCAAVARFALGWSGPASWLAGIALSTTSMAVVYSVLLETGLNQTGFGKGILGACFVNDLGTVVALGLIFSPFTWHTVAFVLGSAATLALLPVLTPRLIDRYAHRTAAFRTKWLLGILFGLGALATWAGSEAVLPAYIAGMLFSRVIAGDHTFVRRFRTLTVGFLTPFYFLRAGSLVSLTALGGAPLAFLALFAAKVGTKIFGLYPAIRFIRRDPKERWYYTLLMSTGLTFGTISALFGLTHGIITQAQYSYLVAVVIGSAVIPTLIDNARFLPKHLMATAAETSAVEQQRVVTDYQASESEPAEEG